ncbi:MAG TPA: arylsulfatase [Lacipirellulaceae bacterium]|jgi:arylsulfatase|nr:arylsulfatase [Lacipirellulaceae bacterium]
MKTNNLRPTPALLAAALIVHTCFAAAQTRAAEESQKQRPNIIVILIDDMGFSDLGCYGGEIPTPNIDKLATEGVRFQEFYNTARCSPSRAALLTGLYPHEAGMGFLDNLVIPGSKGTQGRLRDDCVTMAEIMDDAGYFTFMTGKWHLGHMHGTPPASRGFMRSLCAPIGEFYFPNQQQRRNEGILYNGKRFELDDPQFGTDWYGPDELVKYGLKFIDESIAEKKPFFYYMPHSSVHFPLQAPKEDIARYRGKYKVDWQKLREARHKKQIDMGLVDAKWPLTELPPGVPDWNTLSDADKDRFDNIMAIYAGMIDHLDHSIGNLIAGLKERGVLDNTVIFLMSDNGGNAESGPRGRLEGDDPGGPKSTVYLGQCWATLANTPFWRYKHFTHEGGIATPLIVHWPNGIAKDREGKFEPQPGHLVDIMPTVRELTGAKYPKEYKGHDIQPEEGTSLVPAIAGKPLDRKQPIFFAHEGNRAIRDGKWKLVMKYKGPWELYDMDADRTERHNLVADEPDVAKNLIAKWDAWAKRADVDEWTGPARNDFGAEIKPPGEKKKAANKEKKPAA